MQLLEVAAASCVLRDATKTITGYGSGFCSSTHEPLQDCEFSVILFAFHRVSLAFHSALMIINLNGDMEKQHKYINK